MATNRSVSADLLRIWGVYFIIVLHVFPTTSNWFTNLLQLISSSCVPILVMLSGSLLLGKNESLNEFFSKRVNRIVIPWVGWTIIFTIFSFIHLGQKVSILHLFHIIFLPLFWFIPMIFGLYLLTPAIRSVIKSTERKYIWFLVLLWLFALIFLPYFRNTEAFPLSPDNGLVRQVVDYLGYFLVGYLVISLPKGNLLRLSIAGMLLVFAGYIGKLSLAGGYFNPLVALFSFSLFGLLVSVDNRLGKISDELKVAISTVSKTTFGIYFFQFLLIDRYPLPNLLAAFKQPQLNVFINAGLIFLISFGVIFLFQKIPALRRLS